MASMPRLPGLPKFRSVNRCECGCPGLTGNRFVPGHDAKLLGMTKRVKAGVWTAHRTEGGDIDPMTQLDALAEWASANLPGEGNRYAMATAIALGVKWAPKKEEKAG